MIKKIKMYRTILQSITFFLSGFFCYVTLESLECNTILEVLIIFLFILLEAAVIGSYQQENDEIHHQLLDHLDNCTVNKHDISLNKEMFDNNQRKMA